MRQSKITIRKAAVTRIQYENYKNAAAEARQDIDFQNWFCPAKGEHVCTMFDCPLFSLKVSAIKHDKDPKTGETVRIVDPIGNQADAWEIEAACHYPRAD